MNTPVVLAEPPAPATTSPITLRPGSTADHDRLWEIFRPVLRSQETYALGQDTTRAEAIRFWTTSGGPWFVAEHDGRVVGACMIHPNQPGLGAHVANAAFVVDPAERGHHIGRCLVEQALAAAQDQGYRAMQFNLVVATNLSAIRLYTSLGFRVLARQPEAFRWHDETYVDALVFHRFLS